MLRRTCQCLSRRQPSLLKPRCLSTTVPHRLATPTSGFAPTWDKIKETLKPPIDQFMPKPHLSYTLDTPSPPDSDGLLRTCTVLTSDPSTTSLQDLLDRIPQFQQGNESGLFTDFLLLVTPSYAASLRNQKHVIEQALTRIFPVKELDKDIHDSLGRDSREAVRLVAAVVDRLPKPSALSASAVGDTGSEGIALRLIANENPIWKPELATDDPRAALSDNKFRFLSFHLNDSSTPSHMLPIVQLPLANTIFHNGLSSTLIWRKYAVQQGGQGLTQIDEQVCDSHRVKLPQQAGPQEANSLALSVPLVPLTSARSVVACMGNIIRRLSANSGLGPQDDTKEAILASHELEQSVTSYHKTRGLSPRAVSVWALVIPEKSFTGGLSMAARVLGERNLPELWKAGSDHDIDPSQPNLLTLLQHGARLHKVLSGGGGWGKKAGLLSLDPDTGYGQHPSWEEIAPAQQTEPEYIQGLSPVPADLNRIWGFEPQELPSIVNKGDYIQFYISPSASSEEAPAQPEPTTTTSTPDQTMSNVKTVEFGSIPSTVDDMPSSRASPAAAQSVVQTYPNHFGALSETGIAMFFGLGSDKAASSSNIHDATDAATKVDVPFGRVRSQSQTSAASSKPKQAATGFGFSPTKPLQSIICGRYISRQLLADQPKTASKPRKRNFGSKSSLGDEAMPSKHSDNIWQNASSSAISRRKLKKTMRIPKIPNKNWTSKGINEARKALKQAGPDTESSGLFFKGLKAMTRNAADTPHDQDFVDSLKGQRLKSWATQTMRDVISPQAFEQWEKDGTIPREPNDIWSDKDIRKAHTFRKRQWKLQKAANKQAYLDRVPLATRTMQDVLTPEALEQWKKDKTIPEEPNNIWSESDIRKALIFKGQKWKLHRKPKSLKLDAISSIPTQPQQSNASTHQLKQQANADHVERKADAAVQTITSLRLQAQVRAQSRVLKEAFRGLLSPAQQHRASLQRALTLSKMSHISEPLLTKRIMHLITMHEPGCPRIRIYEILNSPRSAPTKGLKDTSEDESKTQPKAEDYIRDSVSQEERQDQLMQETEMRDQLGKWKTAAEELREAIELKWPEESKKKRLKDVVAKEMDEIRRVEKSVDGFLVE